MGLINDALFFSEPPKVSAPIIYVPLVKGRSDWCPLLRNNLQRGSKAKGGGLAGHAVMAALC